MSKIVTTESFIAKATSIHGNRYDYSKTVYTKAKQNVVIICNIHGEFNQLPTHHIKGCGCSKCNHIGRPSSNKQEFETKANKVHNDRYSYNKAIYTNVYTKICICCSKHGDFWQRPDAHLSGQGCPKCKASKGELAITNWLTEHNISFIPQHTFDDCKGKRWKLPFDFYLPEHNTCIEFDGEQHFRNKFNEHTFVDIQRTDSIKTIYCKEKGIRLIRIPFWKIDLIDQELKLLLVAHPVEENEEWPPHQQEQKFGKAY